MRTNVIFAYSVSHRHPFQMIEFYSKCFFSLLKKYTPICKKQNNRKDMLCLVFSTNHGNTPIAKIIFLNIRDYSSLPSCLLVKNLVFPFFRHLTNLLNVSKAPIAPDFLIIGSYLQGAR